MSTSQVHQRELEDMSPGHTAPTQYEVDAYIAHAKQLRVLALSAMAKRLFCQPAELMERMTLRPSNGAVAQDKR